MAAKKKGERKEAEVVAKRRKGKPGELVPIETPTGDERKALKLLRLSNEGAAAVPDPWPNVRATRLRTPDGVVLERHEWSTATEVTNEISGKPKLEKHERWFRLDEPAVENGETYDHEDTPVGYHLKSPITRALTGAAKKAKEGVGTKPPRERKVREKKPPTPKSGPFGLSNASVARWMAKDGFTTREGLNAFAALGIKIEAPHSIRAAFSVARAGKGAAPPELTQEQRRSLRTAAGRTPGH